MPDTAVPPPPSPPSPRQTRAKIANWARHHPDEDLPPELLTERAEAVIAAHIRKVVAQAPPLSPEQRDRLAVLLRPGDQRAEGAA